MSIYALSDLHDRYDLYEKVLEFLNPEDIVYFLGDAADRGPDGWKLIKAIARNKQFIYIKGNHELMLEDAMREEFGKDFEWNTEATHLLFYNGGYETWEAWTQETERVRTEWFHLIHKLPYIQQYINKLGQRVILTHAGCNVEDLDVLEEYAAVWSRSHFLTPWDSYNDNYYIVHGHTSIESMLRRNVSKMYDDVESLFYASGHKICIDAGAFKTGKCILLNLDTFEEFVFEIKE